MNELPNLSVIMKEVPIGVAIADASGEFVYGNEIWDSLSEGLKAFSLDKLKESASDLDANGSIKNCCSVTIVKVWGLLIAFVNREREQLSIKSKILNKLIPAISNKTEMSKAVVSVLGSTLDWRWVGVARYSSLAHEELETLAFWDKDHCLPNIRYSLRNSTCQTLLDSDHFIKLKGIKQDHFPGFEVKVYAGFAFRDSNGNMLGHVFLMNDSDCVDWSLAEEVLNMVSVMLGASLKLQGAQKEADKHKDLARTDSLTGLKNRMAFDEDIEIAIGKGDENVLLAIIDLDGMKGINDLLGHDQGDVYLKDFSKGLEKVGRSHDGFYRIGGDEFACIFYLSELNMVSAIRKRIANVVDEIKLKGFKEIGASVGFASLREGSGSSQQLIKLADTRMYEDKRKNKSLKSQP